MQQIFEFGGTFDYGESYLEYIIWDSEVIRLHAIQYDAAGAVIWHSGNSPGYWNVVGWGPNSRLLVHVTGLLVCLYVKLFRSSIFNSVAFRSSMYSTVLDFELADENVTRELRVFIGGNVQGYSFRPPKKYKPTEQGF